MLTHLWNELKKYFTGSYNVALHLRSNDFPKREQSIDTELLKSHKNVLDTEIFSLEDICPNILSVTEEYGPIDTLILTMHGNPNGVIVFSNSHHRYDLQYHGNVLDCLNNLPKTVKIILQSCYATKSDPDKISLADLLTAYAPPSAEIYGSESVVYYTTLQIQFDAVPIAIKISIGRGDIVETLHPYQPNFKNKCKQSLDFYVVFEDACRRYGLSDYTSDQEIAACYLDDTCFEDRLTRLPSIYDRSKILKISDTKSEFPKYLKNPRSVLSENQIQLICQNNKFFYHIFNTLCSKALNESELDNADNAYESIRTALVLNDFKHAFDLPVSKTEITSRSVFEQFQTLFVWEQPRINLFNQIQNNDLTFVEKCEEYLAFSVFFERDCRKMGLSKYTSDPAMRACYGDLYCLLDRFKMLPPIYELSKQLDLNAELSDFSKLAMPERVLNAEETKELCDSHIEFYGLFPELCSTVSDKIVDLEQNDILNQFLLPSFSDFKKSFLEPDKLLPTAELTPIQEVIPISEVTLLGTVAFAALAKKNRCAIL